MSVSAPGLLSLPEELLGACLDRLCLQDGPCVMLACKRLRTLFYEQPSVWRRFDLAPPASVDTESKLAHYYAAKLALLRRVAPLVQDFAVSPAGCDAGHVQLRVSPPVADFLPLLPPSLTALDLNPTAGGLPQQTIPLLQPLAALRRLRVRWLVHVDGLPAALQRMPQLQYLDVGMSSCPGGLVHSIRQLSGLTSLNQTVTGPVPDLGSLTQLAQLQHLTLMQFPPFRPPPPAAFPRLQTFCFPGDFGGVEVAGVHCRDCRLSPVQIGDQRVTTLHLGGPMAEQPLAPLLDVAIPLSVELQALSLFQIPLSAAALQGCTQLAALRALKLWYCDGDEAAAAALVGCSTCLSALSLRCLTPHQVDALFAQPPPQLRALELDDAFYLPPQLSLLTGLTYLSTRTPELTLDDVELLSRLPHLHTLVLNSLDRSTYEHGTAIALRTLRRRLPGLQVESTVQSF